MKKFLTKKGTMIGSIVAAAVVLVLLLVFCIRPVSVGYTYKGELEMGGAKFTAKAHINSFKQMTLSVYDEDGEKVESESGKYWYIEKDGYLFQIGDAEKMDKEAFKDAKETFNERWEDFDKDEREEYAKFAGFKINAFKAELNSLDAEFTCGGAIATVIVLAVVEVVLAGGAVASIILRKKKA